MLYQDQTGSIWANPTQLQASPLVSRALQQYFIFTGAVSIVSYTTYLIINTALKIIFSFNSLQDSLNRYDQLITSVPSQ